MSDNLNNYPREESDTINNSVVDGVQLIVGKEYWFKYNRCESHWFKKRVTHLTSNGHAWAGTGVHTDGYYYVREIDDEATALDIAKVAVRRLNNPEYFNNEEFTKLGEQLIEMFLLGTEWGKRSL